MKKTKTKKKTKKLETPEARHKNRVRRYETFRKKHRERLASYNVMIAKAEKIPVEVVQSINSAMDMAYAAQEQSRVDELNARNRKLHGIGVDP